MTNVREFKPKAKPPEHECASCPDCGCEEWVLWLIESVIVTTCAECDLPVDMSEFTLYKP